MMQEIKQGAKANMSGHILEKTIIPMMQGYGYKVVIHSETKKHPELLDENKIVFTNVPFTSIYNHTGKTEYVIINTSKGKKIRVEAKNQQSAGSVDEKFPNLFLNAIYSYPEDEIILLIEGKGWKVGALNWIRNAVEEYDKNYDIYGEALKVLKPMLAPNQPEPQKKKIHVMNLSEFLAYFTKELV